MAKVGQRLSEFSLEEIKIGTVIQVNANRTASIIEKRAGDITRAKKLNLRQDQDDSLVIEYHLNYDRPHPAMPRTIVFLHQTKNCFVIYIPKEEIPATIYGSYNNPVEKYCGDVITAKEFRDECKCGGFMDCDGYGYPVKDNLVDDTGITIYPSQLQTIPEDATHIVWFDK